MIKTTLIGITLAFACLGYAKDITLFDTSTPADRVVQGRTKSVSEKPAPRDDQGRLYFINEFRILGDFDLSKNTDLAIEYVNCSKETFYSVVSVDFFDKSGREGTEPNRAISVMLDEKEGRAVVEGYQNLKDPSILADMKIMRTDPFGRGDRFANADMSAIRAVSFWKMGSQAPRGKYADIRITKITALDTSNKTPRPQFAMTAKEFFPFIDKYGQFKFRDWPNKVRSDADFARLKKAEDADLASHKAPANRDKFGGYTGVKLEATGRFRIQKYDGKWWLVDPEGHLFWSHGIVRVTPSSAITPLDGREKYFENLPKDGEATSFFYTTQDELLAPYYAQHGIKKTYDFSAANIFRKYGRDWRNAFAETVHKRLRSWGLNTIANGSDRFIYSQNKTPFIERIETRGPTFAGSRGAWWGVCDPFDPAFTAHLRNVLESRKAEFSNPWCIGLFVDNELHWGTNGFLGKCALKSPATNYGKRVLVDDLKAKYANIEALNKAWKTSYADWDAIIKSTTVPENASVEDLEAFSLKTVEKYFKTIRDEIKRFDPQLLYLGCRFYDNNKKIVSLAAKYCDAVSFNVYCYRMDWWGLPKGIDKPIMIGEFHFGATSDSGLFSPSLLLTTNQKKRAEAYMRYVTDALENYHIIGTHWHQFSDQATTGRFDGENFQVGFTDVCDTPYADTVNAAREIGQNMYDIRLKSPNKTPVNK